MKNKKGKRLIGLLSIGMIVTMCIPAYADSGWVKRAYHAETVDPAYVETNLYLREWSASSCMDTSEDCELKLNGYFNNTVEDTQYPISLSAYTSAGCSIGDYEESPFLNTYAYCEYYACSENTESNMVTMEIDVYSDDPSENVKYY